MRRVAKTVPLIGPWILSASRAYSLQEGSYRHAGGNHGDIKYR
jgi:hypothetical protein